MESQIIMTLRLPSTRKSLVLLCGTAVLVTVSGCGRNNEIDVSAGVGITAMRDKCPAVAVALYTGDITLFDPATSRDASAVDVVATITDLVPQCNDTGEKIYQQAGFDGIATSRHADPASTGTPPYFGHVLQSGTAGGARTRGTREGG